jgi:hypothetical protein
MPRSGGVDVRKFGFSTSDIETQRNEGKKGWREEGKKGRREQGKKCDSRMALLTGVHGLARIAQFLTIPLSLISPFFHLVALFL